METVIVKAVIVKAMIVKAMIVKAMIVKKVKRNGRGRLANRKSIGCLLSCLDPSIKLPHIRNCPVHPFLLTRDLNSLGGPASAIGRKVQRRSRDSFRGSR